MAVRLARAPRRAHISVTLCALALVACNGESAGPSPEIAPEAAAPAPSAVASNDEAFVLVVLGDSLTAGFGLEDPDRLVNGLQARMAEGREGVIEVRNAGVSGETAEDGLRRFDWSVTPDADGVLVELGANDMFAGRDPSAVRADLAAIIERAEARELWVGLVGMRAPVNAGEDYRLAFDAIYGELSDAYCAPLYPWYFDGIIDPESGATRLELLLDDGLHPNAAGIDVVAERLGAWLAGAIDGEEDPC